MSVPSKEQSVRVQEPSLREATEPAMPAMATLRAAVEVMVPEMSPATWTFSNFVSMAYPATMPAVRCSALMPELFRVMTASSKRTLRMVAPSVAPKKPIVLTVLVFTTRWRPMMECPWPSKTPRKATVGVAGAEA